MRAVGYLVGGVFGGIVMWGVLSLFYSVIGVDHRPDVVSLVVVGAAWGAVELWRTRGGSVHE